MVATYPPEISQYGLPREGVLSAPTHLMGEAGEGIQGIDKQLITFERPSRPRAGGGMLCFARCAPTNVDGDLG